MEVLKRLQDPHLVANIQNFFGVDIVKKWQTNSSLYNINNGARLSSKKNNFQQNSGTNSRVNSKNNTFWASAMLNDDMVGSSGIDTEDDTGDVNYVIRNKFWYSLFYLATKTGDEIFYIVFFPFWAWNVDGAVLRRIMVIWMLTMYVGQALKDILCVPRPSSPPVVKLDPKWQLEYGLPSTHAMVAFSIPFSIVILSISRYQLHWGICFGMAVAWCFLVCISRIYLGMHSVLDILCGLLLVSLLMAIILPIIDILDHLALTHPLSPLISAILTVALVVCYPNSDRWTSARGDTAVIVGVGCGCLIGSWLNYQLGIIREPSILPPYTIIWPTLNMAGLALMRTILGLVLLIAVRGISKSVFIAVVCGLLQVNPSDYKKNRNIDNKTRNIVELSYKFLSCLAMGFTFIFTAPLAFRIIGIERPTFYTEV